MAVPKRKTTKSRAGKRRSHIKLSPKNIIEEWRRIGSAGKIKEDKWRKIFNKKRKQIDKIFLCNFSGIFQEILKFLLLLTFLNYSKFSYSLYEEILKA